MVCIHQHHIVWAATFIPTTSSNPLVVKKKKQQPTTTATTTIPDLPIPMPIPDLSTPIPDLSIPDLSIPPSKEPSSSSSSSSLSMATIWKMALAGGIATIVGDTLVHPIDCIKTLQQSDAGMLLSFSQATQFLWKEYGFGGFYRGLSMYLLSDSLGGSVKFATFETLKSWSSKTFPKDQEQAVNYLCAAIAFVVSSCFLVPGEFLKQQLQMGYYDSLPQAIVGTLENDGGLSGFFTGYDGVCLRDVPYTTLELGLYDHLKTFCSGNQNGKELKPWQQISAAAVTGGIAGFLTTPLDSIKTKLMVDDFEGGFSSCLMQTIDEHGFASLFAGGAARVMWLVPFTALYLPLFDSLKRQFLVESDNTTTRQSSS